MQQLAEQKLKAFAVGNMGKRALTKRELEELRKKEEDEAAAFVCFLLVFLLQIYFFPITKFVQGI